MAKKPKIPKAPKAKTGPKPEVFKIDGMNFGQAMAKLVTKKRPAGGWPKK